MNHLFGNQVLIINIARITFFTYYIFLCWDFKYVIYLRNKLLIRAQQYGFRLMLYNTFCDT